jgi:hypothetical protein
MDRINYLVEEGNKLKVDFSKEKANEVSKWLAELQLFVETTYPKLEFTKSLIGERLVSIMEGVKTHVEYEVSKKDEFKSMINQMK